jgi:hypothetical protein
MKVRINEIFLEQSLIMLIKGDYVDGKKSGYGVYTYSDGRKYQGAWLDDKITGKGKLTYPNGDIYEGTKYLKKEPENLMMKYTYTL